MRLFGLLGYQHLVYPIPAHFEQMTIGQLLGNHSQFAAQSAATSGTPPLVDLLRFKTDAVSTGWFAFVFHERDYRQPRRTGQELMQTFATQSACL